MTSAIIKVTKILLMSVLLISRLGSAVVVVRRLKGRRFGLFRADCVFSLRPSVHCTDTVSDLFSADPAMRVSNLLLLLEQPLFRVSSWNRTQPQRLAPTE